MELGRPITEYAQHGETLLLEEGDVPRKGAVTLNLHLFVTPQERLALEAWKQQDQDQQQGQQGQEGQEQHHEQQGPTTTHGGNSVHAHTKDTGEELKQVETKEEDAFLKSRKQKRDCIYKLEPFDVLKNDINMLDLKKLISQNPAMQQLAKIRHIEIADPKQLRIRELDKRYVPRKVYRDDSKPLSKIKSMNSHRHNVVQLLTQPEQIGPNDLLLFVQHHNMRSKVNSPDWPCTEICFKGGTAPKLVALQNLLLASTEATAAVAGEILVDNLVVAKFFPKNLLWKMLHVSKNKAATNSNRSRGKRKNNNNKNRHTAGNLKSKFQLQDGDLLAFADASLCGTTKREEMNFLREEDEIAQQYKQMAMIDKKNQKSKAGKSGGSVKKVKRAAPVGDAKIHVYLGFSSEEEEEEEENEGVSKG